MDEYYFEQYTIRIENKDCNTCSISFQPNKGKAFKKERRKIYIVSSPSEVFYVGEATHRLKQDCKEGAPISIIMLIMQGQEMDIKDING